MQKFTRTLAKASVIALMGALAACGDDVVVGDDPRITLTPPNASLRVGESVTFSAAVSGVGNNRTVTWTTSDAAKVTVDNAGKATAVAAGTATITASAGTGNTAVTASAQVIVSGRGVNGITINPPNAILAPGQTLQLAATVDADAGVARTVTWASNATAVATVSTSGVITAVGPGNASISATSTVDNTVSANMALTVRPITQAQISIQAITFGATNTPVNINNTFGQIDVVLNVDPGDERVTQVAVTIDGTTACTRNLSASESDALRIAAAFEEVQAVDIVCSINTADFDATTGIAKYLNGSRTIAATATVAGPPQRTITATSQAVVFNNANGYTLSNIAFTGTTATATSTTGFGYRRGGMTATILPVIYSGALSIAQGTLTFGNPANCDASTIGPRTVALVAGTGAAWTATFSQTGTPGTGNVNQYEFSAAACPASNATGEAFRLTATDNQGNTLFAAMQPADSATRAGIRLDNRAPGAPTFVANPNVRQNSWINGAVGLTGVNTSATDNDWLANGAADAGVGGYTRLMRIGDGPTVDAAIAATASATPTLPAPSATNTSYCAVISATDALGNESALPVAATVCTAPPVASSTPVAAQHLSFGVDIAAPTIAFSGGLGSNARINTPTVAGEFQVTVTDTGTVGNSGMLSNAAVVGTVTLRNATATGAATCVIGNFAQGTCNPVSVNAAPAFPLVPTTTIAANTTTGYFTYSAVAQDAAGNQSAAVTRVVAHDDGAIPTNVPALTQALFNTPLNGPQVVFNANSSDNFDLRDVTYSLTYAGGLAGPIVYPAVALNAFNATPLVNSNVAAGITINGFLRQIEDVTGAGPLTVSGQYKPTGLSGVVRDQANNSSAAVVTGIPGASVTNGVSYLTAAATQLINSWAITNAATNVSTGATTPAANPLTVTLNADAFGPTATFNPPFTRVDFYVVSGGNLVQVGSSTSVSTVDDGSAQGRRHRYSFTWTPGTTFGTAAQTIYAIGVNANGDGLVTPANAAITTTNP